MNRRDGTDGGDGGRGGGRGEDHNIDPGRD